MYLFQQHVKISTHRPLLPRQSSQHSLAWRCRRPNLRCPCGTFYQGEERQKSMAEWPTLPEQPKGRPSGSSGDPLPAEAGARMPPFKPPPVKGKPKARGSVGELIGSPPPVKKASVPEKKMPAKSPLPLKPPPATPAEASGSGSVP